MTIDELIARAKEASENQCMDDLCRENFKQLAEWLEELKQYREQYKEQNQESNLDHYRDEVLENCMWNLALVNGRPKRCNQTRCSDCEFDKDSPRKCHKRTVEWLKQPYIKPTYKLTKFEQDLLQSCSQVYSPEYQFKNIAFLTEMREKGYFKDVGKDATLEDILADCEITEED